MCHIFLLVMWLSLTWCTIFIKSLLFVCYAFHCILYVKGCWIKLSVGGQTAGSPFFTAESEYCKAGEGYPGTRTWRPGENCDLIFGFGDILPKLYLPFPHSLPLSYFSAGVFFVFFLIFIIVTQQICIYICSKLVSANIYWSSGLISVLNAVKTLHIGSLSTVEVSYKKTFPKLCWQKQKVAESTEEQTTSSKTMQGNLSHSVLSYRNVFTSHFPVICCHSTFLMCKIF